MGGVSSVYIRPASPQNEAEIVENVTGSEVSSGSATLQWQLNSSDSSVSEENVRLKQENIRLVRLLQINKGSSSTEKTSLIEDDGGETNYTLPARATSISERSEENALLEVVVPVDVSTAQEDTSRVTHLPSSNASECNLQAFRERLAGLRETRQSIISEKSREMRELKEQLMKEKERRIKLEGIIKAMQGPGASHDDGTGETPEDFQNEVLESTRAENRILHKRLTSAQMEANQMSAKLLQYEHDLSELRRKHERVQREYSEIEEVNLKLNGQIKVLEEERKHMWDEYDKEKEEINQRTTALKEVVRIIREMLLVREQQVNDLKIKLKEIEDSVAENLRSTDLKAEYEKQLQNIKELKELYEERSRLLEVERQQLKEEVVRLEEELSDLNIKYGFAADEVDTERQTVQQLTAQLLNSTAQAKGSQRELTLINTLLTQMLVGSGPPGQRVLDRLAEQLEQNHALMAQITSCEQCSDDATHLPKLLLDLCSQVEERDWAEPSGGQEMFDPMTASTDTISEPSEGLPCVSYKNAKEFNQAASTQSTTSESASGSGTKTPTPFTEADVDSFAEVVADADPAVQEIITNLPKVWRVLSELLSHHATEVPPGEARNCYKRVDTPDGPRTVISVSDTFIKLKELIIEKKQLIKEVSRLKHLNSHLEIRLDDQEKRLSTVQGELHKTWGIFGRMRAQHQQLHNQEKILRYELQEKRIMVNELKSELDDCRDLWERARRKNNESETECVKLRSEFQARRAQMAALVCQESAESGFSDSDEHCDADRSTTPSPTPVERLSAETITPLTSVSSPATVSTESSTCPTYSIPSAQTGLCSAPVERLSPETISPLTSVSSPATVSNESSSCPTYSVPTAQTVLCSAPVERLSAETIPPLTSVSSPATVSNESSSCPTYSVPSAQTVLCSAPVERLSAVTMAPPTLVAPAATVSTESSTYPTHSVPAAQAGIFSASVEALGDCDPSQLLNECSELGSDPLCGVGVEASDFRSQRSELDKSASALLLGALLDDDDYSSVAAEDMHSETVEVPFNSKMTTDEACSLMGLPTPTTDLFGNFDLVRSSDASDEPEISELCCGLPTNPLNSSTLTLDSILSSADLYCALDEPPVPSDIDDDDLTEDERTRARDARSLRLQRLEEQCQLLVRKVDITTHKSRYLSDRLEQLHDHYASSPSISNEVLNVPPEQGLQTVEVNQPEVLVSIPGSSVEMPENIVLSQELLCEGKQKFVCEITASLLESIQCPPEATPALLAASCTDIANPELSHSSLENEGVAEEQSHSRVLGTMGSLTSVEHPQLHSDHPEEFNSTSLSVVMLPVPNVSPPEPPAFLPQAGTSIETFEERLVRREERMKRLEDQCNSLHGVVKRNVLRSNALSDRLSGIHEETNPEEQLKTSVVSVVMPDLSSSGSSIGGACSIQGRDTSIATLDERMARREERMKRLEAQCKSLHGKVSSTVERGNELSDRLSQIHEDEMRRGFGRNDSETEAVEIATLPLVDDSTSSVRVVENSLGGEPSRIGSETSTGYGIAEYDQNIRRTQQTDNSPTHSQNNL